MHAIVHVGHEFVEMGAALTDGGRAFEEQVHQHGLAATDLAAHIEALDRRRIFFVDAEEPAERGRFSRQSVLGEAIIKADEFFQRIFLRAVTLDLAGGDEVLVELADGHAGRFFRKAADGGARDKVSASTGQATDH
jgi:hypothetical protein